MPAVAAVTVCRGKTADSALLTNTCFLAGTAEAKWQRSSKLTLDARFVSNSIHTLAVPRLLVTHLAKAMYTP
jgi:hypothetical protein